MSQRKWIPKVGDKVKLKLFEQYTGLRPATGVGTPGITYPEPWAWFEVLPPASTAPSDGFSPSDGSVLLRHICRAVDAGPAWEGRIPLSWLEPPLGWESSYTIYCSSSSQAQTVIADWFQRGIHVWTSHDLSCAGRMAFTPFVHSDGSVDGVQPGVEPAASPHWQYTAQPVESIFAEDCPHIFSVVWREEWEPNLPSVAAERKKEIKRLRAELGAENVYWTQCGPEKIWTCVRETVLHSAPAQTQP